MYKVKKMDSYERDRDRDSSLEVFYAQTREMGAGEA